MDFNKETCTIMSWFKVFNKNNILPLYDSKTKTKDSVFIGRHAVIARCKMSLVILYYLSLSLVENCRASVWATHGLAALQSSSFSFSLITNQRSSQFVVIHGASWITFKEGCKPCDIDCLHKLPLHSNWDWGCWCKQHKKPDRSHPPHPNVLHKKHNWFQSQSTSLGGTEQSLECSREAFLLLY